MTLQNIFDTFTAGSQGFISAVQTHCGFDLSDEEIKRIAQLAQDADDFVRIWAHDDFNYVGSRHHY